MTLNKFGTFVNDVLFFMGLTIFNVRFFIDVKRYL